MSVRRPATSTATSTAADDTAFPVPVPPTPTPSASTTAPHQAKAKAGARGFQTSPRSRRPRARTTPHAPVSRTMATLAPGSPAVKAGGPRGKHNKNKTLSAIHKHTTRQSNHWKHFNDGETKKARERLGGASPVGFHLGGSSSDIIDEEMNVKNAPSSTKHRVEHTHDVNRAKDGHSESMTYRNSVEGMCLNK